MARSIATPSCGGNTILAEMSTDCRAEWSWANVVLKKSPPSSEPKLPRNLSTCPVVRITGQVDRLVSTFRSSGTPAPDGVVEVANSSRASLGPCYRDSDEYRDGVDQQHAGTIREWAENCARLVADRPPRDVPLRRWHQLINDIGKFVDSGWAEKAAALGWTLVELVGVDYERPFGRLDKAGLLWLLNGKQLVAMCENTATIETTTGVRQTYHRRSDQPGRALAWEG
jgi:hypothetical protein